MKISTWTQQIRDGIHEQDELLKLTGHENNNLSNPQRAIKAFPPRVPTAYLKLIEKNNLNDPLLRQVLPVAEEEIDKKGYTKDPVGEFNKHASPGLIRKYNGRALLITTNVCPIHCRYCFRRHYPYLDNNARKENWNAALNTLNNDSSIKEIILSGGDPLSMTDNKLQSLLQKLEKIKHLEWLRIHTRMPVAIPDRITPELACIISNTRFKKTLVLHSNHPNEIGADVITSLKILHNSGIQLLNQSVLLREVNDNALILSQLSTRLYENFVIPYYIHMLDPVAGAAHFEVPEQTAKNIMRELRSNLPGYLVPRLVKEVEGMPYKLII